jgi:hypothetical protein
MVVMEKMAKLMDHDIVHDPISRDDDPPLAGAISSSRGLKACWADKTVKYAVNRLEIPLYSQST